MAGTSSEGPISGRRQRSRALLSGRGGLNSSALLVWAVDLVTLCPANAPTLQNFFFFFFFFGERDGWCGVGGHDLRSEVEGLMSGSHWSRVFRLGIFRQGSVKRCVSQAVSGRHCSATPRPCPWLFLHRFDKLRLHRSLS